MVTDVIGPNKMVTHILKLHWLMKKNPTLTKNMPYVKTNLIPPLKGPDPQGIKAPVQQPKRFKNILTVSKPKI